MINDRFCATYLARALDIRLPGVIVAGTLITAASLLGLGLAGRYAGAPGRQVRSWRAEAQTYVRDRAAAGR